MNGKFILASAAERQELDWGTFFWISRPATTGSKNLAVIFVEIKPGKGHDFHRHPGQDEVIHVLEGQLEQWLETEKRVIQARDSVFVPRGTVHASFNTGTQIVKALAILGPCAGNEGYELIDVSGEAPWKGLREG